MTYRKKLIEVALPLDAINREAAKEKSIRHGHPSTLHLWWARRPLAACRAVLFSSLVDDPDSDPAYAAMAPETREHAAGEKRQQLFRLIEELVKWDNSNNEMVINAARAEIARCVASRKLELGELKKTDELPGGETVWDLVVKGHGDLDALRAGRARLPKAEAVNAFLAKHAPPVLDPFCGGGSIPLEAQRLGLRAYASDLNPVAVLITKALIEIPPKFAGQPPVHPPEENEQARSKGAWHGADGLAEDVRYYGKWMRDETEKRIGHLYPKVKITAEMTKDRSDLKAYLGRELTVVAWLWARTVPSPNPAIAGTHVPLVRSFWLSTKKGKEAWVEPVIDAKGCGYRFEVRAGTPTPAEKKAIEAGTKIGRGCKFRCLLSSAPIPEEHVKDRARAGELGVRLMGIVAEGERGRLYISPTDGQEAAAQAVDPDDRIAAIHTPLANDPRNLWCLAYGLDHFDKLFTRRQLVALTTFSDLVMEAREKVLADARTMSFEAPAANRQSAKAAPEVAANPAASYATAVATYLAFAQSKACNRNTSLCIWETSMDRLVATFGRQALPMVWDFAETNPLAGAGGDLFGTVVSVCEVLDKSPDGISGEVEQHDAATPRSILRPLMIATDPPYYDNIGYADLADFFYIWLRRSIGTLYPSLFPFLVTPKAEELIASSYRHEGSKERAMSFFESGLGRAFKQMREGEHPEYPLTVYYAFKQSESDEVNGDDTGAARPAASTGWETMLEGLVLAGFSITGTWPMRTEQPKGLRAHEQNALASSIVLVCHPRAANAAMTTRKDFVAALKKELPAALRDLQSGNIAPVDLAQAAIGPGMAIYSRYSKVVNSDGSRMPVRTALQLINQALDEVLSEQESEFDSDTRWAIKWFEQHAHDDGPFGDAETLSKAMAVSVNGLKEAGFVKAGQGKVRLLRREELAADWDPATDARLTIWEVSQYLIRRLEEGGESAAAELLRKVGSLGEVARDLAYRLYSTCERKKWAEEARSYNGLVVAWPEIVRLSRQAREAVAKPVQAQLFAGDQ